MMPEMCLKDIETIFTYYAINVKNPQLMNFVKNMPYIDLFFIL